METTAPGKLPDIIKAPKAPIHISGSVVYYYRNGKSNAGRLDKVNILHNPTYEIGGHTYPAHLVGSTENDLFKRIEKYLRNKMK